MFVVLFIEHSRYMTLLMSRYMHIYKYYHCSVFIGHSGYITAVKFIRSGTYAQKNIHKGIAKSKTETMFRGTQSFMPVTPQF